jgi:hypothetical protein
MALPAFYFTTTDTTSYPKGKATKEIPLCPLVSFVVMVLFFWNIPTSHNVMEM